MKLLFDQNISFRLCKKIHDVLPELNQVRQVGLENATDLEIWEYAKNNNFSIVTFDSDFFDISVLKGHPPKIIWIRTGNTTTNNLEILLRKNRQLIHDFIFNEENKEISCLEIYEE